MEFSFFWRFVRRFLSLRSWIVGLRYFFSIGRNFGLKDFQSFGYAAFWFSRISDLMNPDFTDFRSYEYSVSYGSLNFGFYGRCLGYRIGLTLMPFPGLHPWPCRALTLLFPITCCVRMRLSVSNDGCRALA